MHEELGRPPVFVLDNRPAVPSMVIVASHEVAEQISRSSNVFPHSVPKSPSTERIMDLIGPRSILLKQVGRCNPSSMSSATLAHGYVHDRATSGKQVGRDSILASPHII